MAKREIHAKAIELRKQGMSYTQIKGEVGVSKSTLSIWLKEYPLSVQHLEQLKEKAQVRVERCRETKARKRLLRENEILAQARKDIGSLTDRELLLCGLFLYWGEGSKTQLTTVSLSNTDPAAILCFKRWLRLLGVADSEMKVCVQLYADMDVEKELTYWSEVLQLPPESFRKPYIKSTNRAGLTYHQRFGHGTCNLIYYNRDLGDYIHSALEVLKEMFIAPNE